MYDVFVELTIIVKLLHSVYITKGIKFVKTPNIDLKNITDQIVCIPHLISYPLLLLHNKNTKVQYKNENIGT